eukprot:snap_masked-scaffold_1-processed-gene-20.24-mRNA-1 protein AED:1.00 eAED:1.00 QI:0/0/0/0/1/1/2/0/125
MKNLGVKMLFIGLRKAFDSVSNSFFLLSLSKYGVLDALIKKITYIYGLAKVKLLGEKEFKTIRLVKGYSLSPSLFILTRNSIIHRLKDNMCEKVNLEAKQVQLMAFADDLNAFLENSCKVVELIQ